MKKKEGVSLWERYLTKEIGIEFKSCLYFFAILVYYCSYRLIIGVYEASILHMAEQIFLCYGMGYVQVYLMGNFDEGDKLGLKEWGFLLFCSMVYTVVAWLCGWFDGNVPVTAGFFGWMILLYGCAFFVYKARRVIDEKLLNEDLKMFQARKK